MHRYNAAIRVHVMERVRSISPKTFSLTYADMYPFIPSRAILLRVILLGETP